MEFFDCLWLDAERGIGKTQLQTKNERPKVTFQTIFLKKLFEFYYFSILDLKRFWCPAVLFGMKPCNVHFLFITAVATIHLVLPSWMIIKIVLFFRSETWQCILIAHLLMKTLVEWFISKCLISCPDTLRPYKQKNRSCEKSLLFINRIFII